MLTVLLGAFVAVAATVVGLSVFLVRKARNPSPPGFALPPLTREVPGPREVHQHVHLHVGAGADPAVVAEIVRQNRK